VPAQSNAKSFAARQTLPAPGRPAGNGARRVARAVTPVPGPEEPQVVARLLDGIARELLEAAPDGLVLVSMSGNILYVNRQMEIISGYSRVQLLGQPVGTLIPEDVRQRHQILEAQYWADPQTRPLQAAGELQLRQADGGTVPVEIGLSPVQVGLTTMIMASVRDVRQQRADDHARQQLLGILDLDPDAVLVVDAETSRIDYANAGAGTLLGYTQEQLCGMTVFDISPSSSEKTRRALLRQHLRGGPGYRHTIQVVRRARDGTEIPCDSRGQLIQAPDGPAKFIIVDRDARERLTSEKYRTRLTEMTALVAQITAMALAGTALEQVYQTLVEETATLLAAENATLLLRDPTGNILWMVAACGPVGKTFLQDQKLLNQQNLANWHANRHAFAVPGPAPGAAAQVAPLIGPTAIARFPGPDSARGLVTVIRAPGRELFNQPDIELLSDLCNQVATVIELGLARSDQQRLAVMEERERIALDLHDTVIQDLIGIGLQLAADLSSMAEPARRDWCDQMIDQLDETIRQLRTVVFESRRATLAGAVTEVVRSTVAEAARALGHRPTLIMAGKLDEMPTNIVEHLIPVLREALSNVARHARADASTVNVIARAGTVVLLVEDNGVGPGGRTPAGMGITNMQQRAKACAGTCKITRRAGGGTRLRWTARYTTWPVQGPAGITYGRRRDDRKPPGQAG